jgi:hypothetical protein
MSLKRLSQFIKSARIALLCGFIASMACVSSYADDAATNVVSAADASARLVIVNAVYGNLSDLAATTNVTKIVAAMVKDDTLDFHPNNNDFGGDPAPNTPKKLEVDYTIDGVAGTQTAYEGGRLKISANKLAPAKKSRLVIVKAVYGDLPNGPATDVTANLADMVENDGLELTVGNFGLGDPAFGKVKKLRVDYKFDGWKKSVTVQENGTLKIMPSIELAGIHRRILFISLWIVSGILAVSAVVAALVLLARKRKK